MVEKLRQFRGPEASRRAVRAWAGLGLGALGTFQGFCRLFVRVLKECLAWSAPLRFPMRGPFIHRFLVQVLSSFQSTKCSDALRSEAPAAGAACTRQLPRLSSTE